MQNGCIGEVRLFAGNFAPRDWAICSGQLLPISSNTALFSIVGTTYGGDGHTTFALPDMRGRVAVGTGNGPGLSTRHLGQKSGSEYTYLNVNNLPPHSHTGSLKVSNLDGEEGDPSNQFLASSENVEMFIGSTNDNTAPNSLQIDNTGSGTPANNMQPYLALNYVICLFGIYPSRN